MAARESLQGFRPQSQPVQYEIMVKGLVIITHPGVGKPLFSFPAFSQPDPVFPNDSSKKLFGVYHRLALDACRVITNHAANNVGDFLAMDHEGKTPIPIDDAKPLPPGNYYYFLGPPGESASCTYPVVKQFSAFRFPSRMPDNWYSARSSFKGVTQGIEVVSATQMSTYVLSRDKYCILSGWIHFNQSAHLVPKADWAWFDANEMYFYSIENERAAVNAHTNGVLLRDDVRRCFDSAFFVFYPAGDGDKFMAYFLHAGGYPDYTEHFHRRLVSIHDSIPVEFIYARFAYNVIKCLLSASLSSIDSVKDNDEVREAAEQHASMNAGDSTKRPSTPKPPGLGTIQEGDSTGMNEDSEHLRVSVGDEESDMASSSASNHSIQSLPQESYADGDERWKKRLFRRIPEMAVLEEVEDPPETVACHTETPRMLRLKSKYMKENPQVWQTSTTPEGSTRDDEEGWYASWMTRPL